jgi:hypothetical protein
MNSEKIQVIFEEITVLKDQLKDAIESANQLADLNADSKNVTTIINRFGDLEKLTSKKIDDINAASKIFRKTIYMAILSAFAASIAVGVGIGYIVVQKRLVNYIQSDILKDQTEAIAAAWLNLETEKQQLAFCVKAQKNKVEFYNNAIQLPVPIRKLQEDKDGHAIYAY